MQAINEETKSFLQTKLQQYLESLENSADIAIDFSKEQIPILLQEIISYELFRGVLAAGTCLLVFIVMTAACYSLKQFIKKSGIEAYGETKWFDKCPEIFIPYLIWLLSSVINLIILFNTSMSLGKVYFSPRLFILEKLAELIK